MMLACNINRVCRNYCEGNAADLERINSGIRLFLRECSLPIRFGLVIYIYFGFLLGIILNPHSSSRFLTKVPFIRSFNELFENLILMYLYDE